MRDFIIGLVLLAAWIILQFVIQATTGFIHVLLGAGVVMLIRGIATSRWGNSQAE